MARRPRIHFDGAIHHVTHRGNNRADLFFDRSDRARYLELLIETTSRFNLKVHALCLMSNHVHLLVQVGSVPLSRCMHNVAFRFAARLNHREGRTGHVFQGRYHSRLVETDEYLLACLRYIHRNPVDAGLVRSAGDYEWSSHRRYLGHSRMAWVETSLVMRVLGETPEQALAAYHRLIELPETLESASDLENRPALESLFETIAHDSGITVQQLLVGTDRRATEARNLAAFACRELRLCKPSDVSRLFHRSDSALRHGIQRITATAKTDPALRRRMDRLLRSLDR